MSLETGPQQVFSRVFTLLNINNYSVFAFDEIQQTDSSNLLRLPDISYSNLFVPRRFVPHASLTATLT